MEMDQELKRKLDELNQQVKELLTCDRPGWGLPLIEGFEPVHEGRLLRLRISILCKHNGERYQWGHTMAPEQLRGAYYIETLAAFIGRAFGDALTILENKALNDMLSLR
jgi:hypothetical protein